MFCFFALLVCTLKKKTTLGLTLNHLAISVKDVNKAADFYSKILYLTEITNRTQKEGIRWFSLGDGKELHLISTITSPVIINKAVHLALTTSHFDALIAQLKKRTHSIFRLARRTQQNHHPCRWYSASLFS